MTVVVQRLIALSPTDDLSTWRARYGDDWVKHADVVIRELDFMPHWFAVQQRLREHPSYQLDWGAIAWEISLDELRALIEPRLFDDEIFVRCEARQNAALNELDPGGRYALVSIEFA